MPRTVVKAHIHCYIGKILGADFGCFNRVLTQGGAVAIGPSSAALHSKSKTSLTLPVQCATKELCTKQGPGLLLLLCPAADQGPFQSVIGKCHQL